MNVESTIPVVGVVLLFLFILQIILIVRMPKVGVWVVGSLVLLAPILLWRFVAAGGFAGTDAAIPLIGVSVTFLFILLVILLVKAPKVGAGLIVAVVIMVVLGLVGVFVAHQSPHQSVTYSSGDGLHQWASVRQQTEQNDGLAIVGEHEAVYEGFGNPPVAPVAPAAPSEPLSPIWSEGVEQEFEADVYPSRRAAVRALGLRLQRWVHSFLTEDANHPPKIVLFQEEHDRSLLWESERTLEKALLGISCSIEASSRNTAPNEIGITFRFEDIQTIQPPPWSNSEPATTVKGRVAANARRGFAETTVVQSFSEKPWVEDFASFTNERPDRQFLVARSQGACTSENEAKSQALGDACDHLRSMVVQKWAAVPGRSPLTVNSRDVQEGGFILDQFVQSFDGAAGRIWRHAVLIDASAAKLAWLNRQKNAEVHSERVTWARIIVSAVGVLVVIVVAYLFLNMATKGYYEWTLRIAGTVLAIAGIIAIFLVLR